MGRMDIRDFTAAILMVASIVLFLVSMGPHWFMIPQGVWSVFSVYLMHKIRTSKSRIDYNVMEAHQVSTFIAVMIAVVGFVEFALT